MNKTSTLNPQDDTNGQTSKEVQPPGVSVNPHTVEKEVNRYISYAPLHLKGISTSIPLDGGAKKAKRLEEVRAKRKLGKERKRMGAKQSKIG